jgi:hypothetical protein
MSAIGNNFLFYKQEFLNSFVDSGAALSIMGKIFSILVYLQMVYFFVDRQKVDWDNWR